MTFVIWKFQLEPGRCTVAMPRNRTLLSIGAQDDRLVMWAMVDPASIAEDVRFAVVGTGWGVPPDNVAYRGTAQMPNGLVWHVMEVL